MELLTSQTTVSRRGPGEFSYDAEIEILYDWGSNGLSLYGWEIKQSPGEKKDLLEHLEEYQGDHNDQDAALMQWLREEL